MKHLESLSMLREDRRLRKYADLLSRAQKNELVAPKKLVFPLNFEIVLSVKK